MEDTESAQANSLQTLAQNEVSSTKLRKNQKKAIKISKDISKMEDKIKDIKSSKQKLLKKDMKLNNKKSQLMEPTYNSMNSKNKAKKNRDVSPNHFYKKSINDVSDFEEPTPR